MLELKVRKKIRIDFSDDRFDLGSTYPNYIYNYNTSEDNVELAWDGYNVISGNLYGLVESGKNYKITLKMYNKFTYANLDDDGKLILSSSGETNYITYDFDFWEQGISSPVVDNELTKIFIPINDVLSWRIQTNDSASEMDIRLVYIIIEEIDPTSISILDAKNGVQLNKSIKEIKEPENFKISYSESFNVVLNEETTNYLYFKNIENNSNYQYLASIEEDEVELINGIAIFEKIDDKSIDGFDIISCIVFENGVDFFDRLKRKTLKELDDDTDFKLESTNKLNKSNIINNNDGTYFFSLMNNGTFDENYESRGVGEQYNNGDLVPNYLCDLHVKDFYPAVYVSKIWDEIHRQGGFTSNGDFFETTQWKDLLFNYYKDLVNKKEDVKNFDFSGEFQETQILTVSHDNGNIYGGYLINNVKEIYFINNSGTTEFTAFGYSPDVNRIGTLEVTGELQLDGTIGTSVDGVPYDRYDDIAPADVRNKIHNNFRVEIYMKPVSISNGEIATEENYIFLDSEEFTFGNTDNLPDKDKFKFKIKVDENLFINDLTAGDTYYKIFFKIVDINYYQVAWYNVQAFMYDKILEVTPKGKIKFKHSTSKPPVPNYGTNYNDVYSVTKFSIKDLVPNTPQIDFIKNIANLFNLRFEIDDFNKVINWYTFDEYYIKNSSVKDFTNKIDKTNITKLIGNEFQSNSNVFKFKECKGNDVELYNSAYELKYGSLIKKIYGDVKSKENVITNGFGIQPFSFIYGNVPITNNTGVDETFNSTLSMRNENGTPFLTYKNIITIGKTFSKINFGLDFRDEFLNKTVITTIPTSTHINKIVSTGSTEDVWTLEYFKSNYPFDYKEPEYTSYDYYLSNEFEDIIGVNAEKLECKLHLTNKEYIDLKLNDIIQFEDNMYRIDSVKGFNENKLTNLDLIKISYNPHYSGTSYTPSPYLVVYPLYNSFGIVNTNTTYTSPVGEFTIDWENLTDDLVVTNTTDSNTDEYWLSFDSGSTWNQLAVGSSYTVSSAATGSLVVQYKLMNVSGVVNPGQLYREYLNFTTSNISQLVTLWARVKTIGITIGGAQSTAIGDLNTNIVVTGTTPTIINTKNTLL